MIKVIIVILSCFYASLSMANGLQNATLRTSLEKRGEQVTLHDFYTYLETAPFIYEGENAFEALTFRGDGIKIFLKDDTVMAKVEGREIVLARLETQVDQLSDGFHALKVVDGVQVRLDHASLGKAFKIKVSSCLPGGYACSTHKVKVTPHRYGITIIGQNGEAFCIRSGFNRNAENYQKVDSTYKLGECQF